MERATMSELFRRLPDDVKIMIREFVYGTPEQNKQMMINSFKRYKLNHEFYKVKSLLDNFYWSPSDVEAVVQDNIEENLYDLYDFTSYIRRKYILTFVNKWWMWREDTNENLSVNTKVYIKLSKKKYINVLKQQVKPGFIQGYILVMILSFFINIIFICWEIEDHKDYTISGIFSLIKNCTHLLFY